MKIQDVHNAVVVPWDFSKMSHQALKTAINTVDPSLIHLVHVTEYPTAYEYGVVWDMVGEDLIVKRLNESYQEAIKENPAFKKIKLNVLFGNPAQQICEVAEELSAELIIMPSHGRSGVAKFFLGSVADRVVRDAPCPVLILREKNVAADGSDRPVSATAGV